MELERSTAELSLRHAYAQMLDVADLLGDERVNRRPPGPATNSVAALIVHCCGVTEFWLGHVGLGRATERDRDVEFRTNATVAELHELVDATLATAGDDLGRICSGQAVPDFGGRQFLPADDETDGALVLHVLEEVYQHLGHMQLTADALT